MSRLLVCAIGDRDKQNGKVAAKMSLDRMKGGGQMARNIAIKVARAEKDMTQSAGRGCGNLAADDERHRAGGVQSHDQAVPFDMPRAGKEP